MGGGRYIGEVTFNLSPSTSSDLIRCLAIAYICHDGEYDVWHPCCEQGRCAGVDGEGGGDGLQHYIYKTEGEACAEVHTHAALTLTGGEGGTDDGEDEGGEGGSYPLMILYLILHDITGATVYLLGDIVLQFGQGEGLLLPFGIYKVYGFHLYEGV